MQILQTLGDLSLVVVAAAFIAWLFIILPERMAATRGRKRACWVLISIFFTPFLAIPLLWLLGDKASHPDNGN